jgi:hypothetical protein
MARREEVESPQVVAAKGIVMAVSDNAILMAAEFEFGPSTRAQPSAV